MRNLSFLARAASDFVNSLTSANWPRVMITLTVGTVGAFVFATAGLPAAFLSGAMVSVAAIAIARVSTEVPDALRDICFFATGIAMGSGVNPHTVVSATKWPLSLAILGLAVFAIGGSVYLFFHRVAGWDAKTSFYASIPGALTFVMALASKSDADIRFVAVSQSIRLFFLVAILPVVLISTSGELPPMDPETIMLGFGDAIKLICAAIFAVFVLSWFRVPAATMVGPFLASAILFGAGLVSGTIQPLVLNAGLIVLGAMIGNRFGSIDLPTLRRLVLVSAGALSIGLSIAVAFAGLTVWVTGLAFGQVLLAFAPGGLEAMIILAFLFDLDPAYVAAHQVARLIGMMIFLPAFVTVLSIKQSRTGMQPGAASSKDKSDP